MEIRQTEAFADHPTQLPIPKPRNISRPLKWALAALCVVFVFLYFLPGDAPKVADVINAQFGRVCEAKIEGVFSNTLRLDWTADTTKLHVIAVMAAVGKSRETIYAKGVRYLKFPNDAGGYNIIDWKTGEKSSVGERAPYYFRG